MTSGWHPVALAADVETGTSTGAKLNGKEIVIWRDDRARAHVWEDRCPHRGMRLSLGFVRGDHLACLYHGWQYDQSGQCRFIPAHPELDVPSTIRVPAYRTREWAGIIWTAPDEEGHGEEVPEGMTAHPVRSLHVELPMSDAVAAWIAHGLGKDATVKQMEVNLCLARSGGDQLLAAFQPISERRTGIHVVIFDQAEAEKLTRHARALEAFRALVDRSPAHV